LTEERKKGQKVGFQRVKPLIQSKLWLLSSRVLEWGIPSLCYHCEIPVAPELHLPLCRECSEIGWEEPRCFRCGNRCHPSEVKGPRCFHCKDVSLPQKSLASFGPYKSWLRSAIIRAKYAGDPACIRYLQNLTREGWGIQSEGVLTFIPSHPRRLKERKAKGQHLPLLLGKQNSLGPTLQLLERVHYTRAQVHLRGDERRKSRENFFKYIGPTEAPEKVILFDDVWTTGATARQAATTLKEAGVKEVHIRVLAISAFEGRT
jgi:predicted amidophosphoribosyltransferase